MVFKVRAKGATRRLPAIQNIIESVLMKITAAIATGKGQPFVIEDVDLDEPRPDEILVRIVAVGLCHTDLAARDEHLPLALPAVLGHEGAGVIERVGSAVTKVAPGDHVVMTMRSCGHCARCRDHDPSYCELGTTLNFTGTRPDGSDAISRNGVPISSNFFGQSSFASHALAYQDNVVKVDKALPLHLLAPLGCGVQTGAGAILRSLACPPKSTLLITGGGSVGLSAVMGAKIAGCATIIVSDPKPERRALAIELGATHVIDPATEDLNIVTKALTGTGVDFALDTTGNEAVMNAALYCLRRRGVMGLLGLPHHHDAPTPGTARDVLLGGFTVRGIIEGDSDPDVFIPELIEHHLRGRLPLERLVTTYGFDQINDAVEDQNAGRTTKAVLLI